MLGVMSRRLTAEELELFLDMVRQGEGLHRAARRLQLDPRAVREARKVNPEFDAAVLAAEKEAAEPVEIVLYEAAKRGEPWAVQMWLKQRDSARWGERPVQVNVTHEVSVEAGPALQRIAALRERLEARAEAALPAGPPVLDAESVEN